MKRDLSKLIEEHFSLLITSQKVPGTLVEPFKYVLFPGGKRIRPKFCLGLCLALGGEPEKILKAALGLEILHTASLIHDDLPALDNDDMRRGRPSCHKQFGESTALLLADFMVPFAVDYAGISELSEGGRLGVTRALLKAYQDLCVGQCLDLDRKNNAIRDIYKLKTGALFSAAAEIAAIGAGLNESGLKLAGAFGRTFGEAFQLVDDYRDRYGTDEERGRVGSSDARNHRDTAFDESQAGFEKGLGLLKGVYDEAAALAVELKSVSTQTGHNFAKNFLDDLCGPIFSAARE